MRAALPPPDIVLTGRFEPGQERRYVHLPFDLPAGVRQLHVAYDYGDRIGSDPTLVGGNTLDIGIFDERGAAAGGPGFRGWSGSNQDAFTIDRDWATPPYQPGPLGAGVWQVLLGPYKIGPRGLDYRVSLWFNPGLPPEVRTIVRPGPPAPARLPPAAEPGWVRGDLHSHTRYSDGDSWPSELLVAAAEAGLDFLGITDHNSVGAHRAPATPIKTPKTSLGTGALDAGAGGAGGLPVLIPGVEVTTYRGHWNVWGADRWFDFRDPEPAAVAAAMREAVAAGGFVSVNHPRPFGPPWEYPEARGHHAVEVWNGPWEALNTVALAYWEARLRAGERLVALGGSDTHRLRAPDPRALFTPRLGQPTLWARVDGPLTPASLLAALRAGRCFVSESPAGPQLYLARAGRGARARVVGAPGAALLLVTDRGCAHAAAITSADQEIALPLPAGRAYARAQLVDAAGCVLALTNPLWLDGG
ncbi:MAG TPA: CehA/McbA family metallohydrolase [Thermomicrobiales bacterium]|nr:CehA/McbA family metallohydrolase [Thermomicrobiales bacterium]